MQSRLMGKRIVLAGLFSAKIENVEQLMGELARAVSDAGGLVVGQLVQLRGVSHADRPGGARSSFQPKDPATVLGSGKVDELAALRRATAADVVVFHGALKRTQRERLEQRVECSVFDRSVLP